MTDPAVTCVDCNHFWATWSITGDTNKVTKCDFDDKAGVAQVGTVILQSDCPWFDRIKINEHSDAYPGARLRDTGASQDTINTRANIGSTPDPYGEAKKKYPSRFRQ